MPYTDVPAHEWYARAVEVATALGLLGGYPDGTFRPDEPVTRAQLAAVAARLANNDLALRRWASLRLRSRVAPAILHIRAGKAVGAGVMVHPTGVLATCHHVIVNREDGRPFDATWPDWQPGKGASPPLHVLAEAPEVDLAICRVGWMRPGGFPYLPIAASPAEPAEPVVMVGSPSGFQGWESHGLIARREVVAQIYQVPQTVLCVSGAINPGNSGGALVRAGDATLLGIVNAKLVHTAIEGMGFAVPVAEVVKLMEQAGITPAEGE